MRLHHEAKRLGVAEALPTEGRLVAVLLKSVHQNKTRIVLNTLV